jgi:hypothetical protein
MSDQIALESRDQKNGIRPIARSEAELFERFLDRRGDAYHQELEWYQTATSKIASRLCLEKLRHG